MKRLLNLTLFVVTFSVFCQNTNADTVTQKDGGFLKGRILGLNEEQKFRIEISGGSILVVTKDDIDKIDFNRDPKWGRPDEIHKGDGSIFKGFITEYIPNDSFKIELSSGNLFIVKETQIEKINFSQRRKKTLLKERIHVGLNLGYVYFMRDTGWFTQKDNTLVKVITLRYSLNQSFDLVLEPRHFTVPVIRWEKGGYIPAAVTGYFTGVGVRNTKRNWFSQTTLYYAREKLQLDIPGSDTVSNSGYFGGVSGGYSIVVKMY